MNSDTKLLIMSIVGSVIGAYVIYRLLKSTFETQNTALQLQQQQLNQYQYQQEIQQIRQPIEQQIQQPIQQHLYSTYKNNEKWAITRNKEGFISNVEVVRNAKTT